MNNEFRLPNENPSGDDAKRRVMDLIEEIRADIDFELDDAVTSIVRDLPEDYFQRIGHEDQVTHLKGLLASRICNFTGELFIQSADASQIAVLGRSNYSGQLAKILSQLPGKETRLTGANIFTSKSHDFILDVFEFSDEESLRSDQPDPLTVELLSTGSGASNDQVSDFLSRIRPSSVQGNAQKLATLFSAYRSLNDQQIVVEMDTPTNGICKVLVAVDSPNEKTTFQCTAALISQYGADIQQAELEILRMDRDSELPTSARSDKAILMNFMLRLNGAQLPAADKWQEDLAKSLGG